MKRLRYIMVLAGLALGGCTEGRERIKPRRSPVTESVYAAGIVKAADQYTVFPLVSGILQQVLVKAGDTVAAGTPLFRLDSGTAGLQTESARLALELSRQNTQSSFGRLREAELHLRTAREKYQLDSLMFRRQRRLWQQQIGTRQEYEQRQLTFSSAKSAYRAARSQLALLQVQLRNELQQARVSYDISRKLQNDYLVRSNLAGRVYDLLAEAGERVGPQTALAVLGSRSQFILELQVDENDIARIRAGQALVCTLGSYPDRAFEGKVVKINPIMDARARTFLVEAIILDPPPALYPNLTAEANIIIRTKENALLIPRNYLAEDSVVYLDKNRRKVVKTGLRDYSMVEILAGLDTTDYIYKPE